MFAFFYFGSVLALGLSMSIATMIDNREITSRKVGGIRFTRIGKLQVSTCYVTRRGGES